MTTYPENVTVIEERSAPTPTNVTSTRALVRVLVSPTDDAKRLGFKPRTRFGIARDGVVRETWTRLADARDVFERTVYP